MANEQDGRATTGGNGARATERGGYAGLSGNQRSWEGTVAITNARLIDGTGADPLEGATLLLEGERITAVGAGGTIGIPQSATVLDAAGMTVLPGLIDCHVHLSGQWGYDLLRGLVTPPSLRLLYAVPNARATLEAGITTVRDAGGTPAAVKMAVERGLFPGPRMRVAVSVLSQTGGHGDGFMPCCVDLHESRPNDVPSGVTDGVEAMRHKVREVLRA